VDSIAIGERPANVEGVGNPSQHGDILEEHAWFVGGSRVPVLEARQELLAVVFPAFDFEDLARVNLLVLDLPDRKFNTGVEPSRHVIPGNATQQYDVVDQVLSRDLGREQVVDRRERIARLEVTEQLDKRVRVGEGVQPRVVRVIDCAERPKRELVVRAQLSADDVDGEPVVEPPGFMRRGRRLAYVLVAEPEKSSRSSSRRFSSSAPVNSASGIRCG
jgi:hypothetical protein